jgi:hypothetical protein
MNTVCIANGNCDYGPGMQLQELQGRLAQLGGGRVRHLRIRQEQKLQHQATGSEDSYATRILHVGSLHLCKQLVTLEILGIGAEVDGLNEIPTLRHQHLRWDDRSTNKSLQDLSQLTNHAQLETLTLANCHRLLNIDALGTCKKLQKLHMQADMLMDISSLGKCTTLQDLVLVQCAVHDISPVASCKKLSTLTIAMLRNRYGHPIARFGQ